MFAIYFSSLKYFLPQPHAHFSRKIKKKMLSVHDFHCPTLLGSPSKQKQCNRPQRFLERRSMLPKQDSNRMKEMSLSRWASWTEKQVSTHSLPCLATSHSPPPFPHLSGPFLLPLASTCPRWSSFLWGAAGRSTNLHADVAVGINPLEVRSKKACSQTDTLKGRVARRDEMRLEHSAEFVKNLVCQGEEAEFYMTASATTGHLKNGGLCSDLLFRWYFGL